jgi:hypothetical protein
MAKKRKKAAAPAPPADPPPAAEPDRVNTVCDIARGMDTVEAWEKLPRPDPGPVARVPRVVIDGDRVFLDGGHLPLGMRPGPHRRALFMIRAYLEAGGEFMSDEALDDLADNAGVPLGHWGRVRRALPASLRALIETGRAGSRLNPQTAWR